MYIGVTSNLRQRAEQHKEMKIPGFTHKYNVTKLIYYEVFPTILDAIRREKQLKGWRRSKKVELIALVNASWDEVDVPN